MSRHRFRCCSALRLLTGSAPVSGDAATLASAVGLRGGAGKALDVPEQGVSWSYEELDGQARRLAGAMQELGVKRGHIVASALPNVGESLLLQLAAAHVGAAVCTVPKDAAARAKLPAPLVASFAAGPRPEHLSDLEIPHVVLLDDKDDPPEANTVNMAELLAANMRGDAPAAEANELMAVFGSAALSHGEAMRLGTEAARRLGTTSGSQADAVCCSVTLLHAFGIASAVGSALVSGAAVVLPAVGGIKGCGNPQQRAEVTVDVINRAGVTQLFGDSHTLRALPARPAGTGRLRTGVIKIGSGSDFLDGVTETPPGADGSAPVPLSWGGVSFHAIGKRQSC